MGGTLDGYIDFAIPRGKTFQLSLGEARAMIAALQGAVADVQANCLYDRDTLLVKAPSIGPDRKPT